jgi:NADP-dependent 3-hydroxy acid dehydrogenase YdfG
VTTLELDGRDLGAIAKAVGSLTAQFGWFDLFVNNARTASCIGVHQRALDCEIDTT